MRGPRRHLRGRPRPRCRRRSHRSCRAAPLMTADGCVWGSRWRAPSPSGARGGDVPTTRSARGPLDDGGWMRVGLAMARAIAVGGAGVERPDNPIAALLVSADGDLLTWAAHTGSLHAMGHAEMNLVECWREPLPVGARVIAT